MVNRKNRCDFFYFTAKKYKFRSRAAFKLIELNKKFSFLNDSQCILDLCAAPGSWMQVTRELAPYSATIIGLDIYPIKKLKGCQTIKGDITSCTCMKSISNLIKIKKTTLTVVLHDGSPKMGNEWLSDVYKQNNLVLSAFKLIKKLLDNKGWFVTKVFKSEYFNNLYFMLKYFFKKIFIFKPIASRDNSSEIYLVCKKYIPNSEKYDFLVQSSFVFKESISSLKFIENFKTNEYNKKNFLPLSTIIKNKKLLSLMISYEIQSNDEILSIIGTSFYSSNLDKAFIVQINIKNYMYFVLNWIEKNFSTNRSLFKI